MQAAPSVAGGQRRVGWTFQHSFPLRNAPSERVGAVRSYSRAGRENCKFGPANFRVFKKGNENRLTPLGRIGNCRASAFKSCLKNCRVGDGKGSFRTELPRVKPRWAGLPVARRFRRNYTFPQRRVGGMVTQRIANPCIPVRFRYSPPSKI